jgi:hypothetical protein
MLIGKLLLHWPRWQFHPRLEPVLSTWGRPITAWGNRGRFPQMPHAPPMSSTCRDVMLAHDCGTGPISDVAPAVRKEFLVKAPASLVAA